MFFFWPVPRPTNGAPDGLLVCQHPALNVQRWSNIVWQVCRQYKPRCRGQGQWKSCRAGSPAQRGDTAGDACLIRLGVHHGQSNTAPPLTTDRIPDQIDDRRLPVDTGTGTGWRARNASGRLVVIWAGRT